MEAGSFAKYTKKKWLEIPIPKLRDQTKVLSILSTFK
jgi:hypothetical protein